MFNNIVVGADDSATARRAVAAAAELASLSGGELHIVSAFSSATFSARAFAQAAGTSEFAYLSTESTVDALLQSLSFIASEHGLNPTLHGVKSAPAEAIIETAEKVDADLVVVGNLGMKGMRRVLGSVPNTVAHGAPCSVLIVDTSE